MAKKSHLIVSAVAFAVGIFAAGCGFSNLLRSRVESGTHLSYWMKDISDDTQLNQLSLPGTHNSGALYSVVDMSGQCQDLDIAEQLQIGVRFLEFRLDLKDGNLNVVHGVSNEHLSFTSCLNDIGLFLQNNPSEFLFVSIIEYLETGEESSSDFDYALMTTITRNSYAREVWSYQSSWPTSVGDCRGKVHQLSRYRYSSFGLSAYWGWNVDYDTATDNSFLVGSNLYVQDYYKARDIATKQNVVNECLEYAADPNTHRIAMNYTSAYIVDSFPPMYVPSMSSTMNTWIIDKLNSGEGYVGFMIGDFVTSKYVEAVISRNNNA